MALETERCSPSNASSPGPTTGRRPGSQGTAAAPDKPKSAFHQIALLTRCASPPPEHEDFHPKLSVPRPPSAESSSNSVQRPPYSDSSPPSSPPGPQSPDQRNGFLYHPDMASLSLVYGLGVGVVPSRFPLNLHLPSVYPTPEPFAVLPRVPTVVPVKPPDPLGAFVARHLPDSSGFVESRLLGSNKPLSTPKIAEAAAPRCDCCRSPSPRSPSPRQPPGPSSLTFSVDNILRPDFGRCRALQRRVRAPKSVKTPEVEVAKTSQSAALDKLATPARSTTPASDDKDANGQVWPAWVYCTRYSDRPSSGRPSTFYQTLLHFPTYPMSSMDIRTSSLVADIRASILT